MTPSPPRGPGLIQRFFFRIARPFMALPPTSSAAARPPVPEIVAGRRGVNTRRLALWVSVVAAVLLVTSAGGAAAAARFDARHDSEFLPGVSVNGVPIGGMEVAEAYAVLARSVEEPLDRTVTVTVAGQSFSFTPREFGAGTDLRRTLEEAAALQRTMPVAKRIWHRLTGNPVGARYEVTRAMVDDAEVKAFVDRVAATVDTPARDAAPQLGPGDILHYTPGVPGRSVDREAAVERIMGALRDGASSTHLETTAVPPAITEGGHPNVLVVKIGENKLLHYQGGQMVKVYDVATGSKKYATPKGVFKIVNKRFRPTWVNPAKGKGQWGASLPARIGPGPGNPLGTRALDLNVGGIRIHGSSAVASIGYNVSHGCIRMRMAEVEELFELVGLGTPVLILQTADFRTQPVAPPTIEDLAEADGTVIPGVTPGGAPVVPPAAPVPPTPATPQVPAAAPQVPAPVPSPTPSPASQGVAPNPPQPVVPAPAG